MKLIIPIAANLVSVLTMPEFSSSSSITTADGRTRELIIQAPIATTNGASAESSALHTPFFNLLFYKNIY